MPQFECEAIIFDMDGVLVDSEVLNEKHWKLWAEKEHVSLEWIMSIHHGVPAEQTITTVAPHLDAATEARWFEENLSKDLDGLLAFEGVHELLSGLPEGKWAIGTSAPKIIAFNRMEYLKLPVPPVVVTIDDVENGKPAPDPYLKAARGMGIDPEHCIVIEDAPAGIKAAKTAGARVIAIPTTNGADALSEADAVVSRFADIAVAVNGERLAVSW
ncbi:MAG: HAD-IA family hydrolase [Rhodothermaceae bacterium]|nr:HAD-IA family hydrolase [Rhodothermaceae bacterium]